MNKTDASSTFRIIRRAMDEIDRSEGAVNLSDLGASMGMSASHFQRLFSKWVGISPKKYQPYLALDHSKQLLRNHHFLLDTAFESELSDTERLHDLFITWESMRPREFARKATGIVIRYAWVDSPFGETLFMTTARGICGISFCAEIGRNAALEDMMRRWPNAEFQREKGPTAKKGFAIFERNRAAHLHIMGAPFQIKVWKALMNIPSGKVSTYSDVAAAIGSPKATRAVGTAIGKNPISWFIPCHRTLRKSGELGGYHWRVPVKRAMLAYEAAKRDFKA